jgi:hypothetical protein
MNWPRLSTRPPLRRRRSWRPNLEQVEGRQLLAVTPGQWLGSYTPPGYSYPAGSQHVVFWAESVTGSFNASTATGAWSQAMGAELTTHTSTLSRPSAVPPMKTDSFHFLLMGWENIDTKIGGWLAARYNHTTSQLVTSGPWWNKHTNTVTHVYMDWMSIGNPGQTNVEGPLTKNFITNHYTIGLYVSPSSTGYFNNSGYVNGSFVTPYFQPPPGV